MKSRMASDELIMTLRTAGLSEGHVVLVQSNLIRCGPIEAQGREATLRFYLDGIRKVLGNSGTLVVLTSFEDYARFGTPFDRISSPSQSGALSEFVRILPDAVRSMHPIVSLTAVGPLAHTICSGPHFDGFGIRSPWTRLVDVDARVLTLGYGVAPDGMTFLHYLENLYGVPYQYTKVFDFPVRDSGKLVEGQFTLSVRYLDFGIENDQTRVKQALVKSGYATLLPIGRGELLLTNCRDVLSLGGTMLDQDRYALLKAPPIFRRGEIPFDGAVTERSEPSSGIG